MAKHDPEQTVEIAIYSHIFRRDHRGSNYNSSTSARGEKGHNQLTPYMIAATRYAIPPLSLLPSLLTQLAHFRPTFRDCLLQKTSSNKHALGQKNRVSEKQLWDTNPVRGDGNARYHTGKTNTYPLVSRSNEITAGKARPCPVTRSSQLLRS